MPLRLAPLALVLALGGCMTPATLPAPGGDSGGSGGPGRPVADAILLTQCRAQVIEKMRAEISGYQRARQTEGRVIRANAREWLAGGEMDVTASGTRPAAYTYVCSVDVADRYRIASARYSRK